MLMMIIWPRKQRMKHDDDDDYDDNENVQNDVPETTTTAHKLIVIIIKQKWNGKKDNKTDTGCKWKSLYDDDDDEHCQLYELITKKKNIQCRSSLWIKWIKSN